MVKINTNNGVCLYSNHSCLIFRICFWLYRVMDTMFPHLLISSISEFSVVGKSILSSKKFLLLPWYLEPLFSLISRPLLSWFMCLPPFSIFFQLFRSLFVLVFLLVSWSHALPILLISDLLEILTFHCCYFYFEWNDDNPIRQLWCTVYAYNKLF